MVNIEGASSAIFNFNTRNPFSRLEIEDIISNSPSRIIVFDRISGLEFRFFGNGLNPFFDPPRGQITRITNERGLNITNFSSPLSSWFDVFLGNRSFNSLVSQIQSGDDSIRGSTRNDILYGYAGNDVINGRQGNDFVDGGVGNDTLTGSIGLDTLIGSSGNDIVIGSTGADRLIGGSGRDNARYITSQSRVIVNLNSRIGTAGDANGDTLISIESLSGSAFSDILTGNSGANTLDGLNGNDRIIGGVGNDLITGGNGRDIISGGSGVDRFRFFSNQESTLLTRDRITDLEIGTDRIDIGRRITSQNITQRGGIVSLTRMNIETLLRGRFAPNQGATFNVGSSTYLAINDNRSNYQIETDAIIDITGFSGSLSNLQTI